MSILSQKSSYVFDRPKAKERAKGRIKAGSVPSIKKVTLAALCLILLPLEIVSLLVENTDIATTPGLIAAICFILVAIYAMFVFVGYSCYIMKIARKQSGAGYADLKYSLKYPAKVLELILREFLYIFFWSLLLVFPGIMAAYRYRFAIYILIDNPEISASEAIRRSKAITQGRKGELFILDLSYLGWILLAYLLNLLGIMLAVVLGSLAGSLVLTYILYVALGFALSLIVAIRLTAGKQIVDFFFYDFAEGEYRKENKETDTGRNTIRTR